MNGEQDRADVERLKARVAELERLLNTQPDAASHADRLAADLKQARDQAAILRTVVANTAAATGQEFFRALAASLASTLGVRCTFVGEIMEHRPGYVRTLALWMGGALCENFEYALADTPCEQIVTRRRMAVFPRGIREQFPDDRYLADLGLESYMGFPLFDERGEVMGLVGVIHDAPLVEHSQAQVLLEVYALRVETELRRLHLVEVLQENEEKYRLLFTRAMDAVVLFDAETLHILDVNDAACGMYGYDREAFSRLRIADISAQPDTTVAAVRQAAQGGGAYVPLRWNRKKDGTIFPVEISCGPFTWRGRTVMCGVLRDITERRRAEEALRESTARLQAILDHSPAMVFLKDTEGRYLLTNRQFDRTFHLVREAVVGKTDREIFPPDQAEAFMANDRKVFLAGAPLEFDEVAVHDDGPHTSLVVKFPLRNEEGGVYALCGITADITERKRLEAQLLRAQKMEAIGRLAGGIAHDFNNLLTVINGYSDLLLRRDDPDSEVSKQAGAIKEAGLRAADLTRQLLAFSRRQIVQPKVLDLNGLVANLAGMLRRLIGEDIRLETVLPPEPLRVKADPGQLEQILMNLAVNARDAMPQGGTLTIEAGPVRETVAVSPGQDATAPGPRVRLTVRDTGCGMDAETRSRIFEPFFSTKGQGKGTGLGLAMVYGIVTQCGGAVTVDSKPGQGAVFMIDLPLVPDSIEAEDEPDQSDDLRVRGETILVVEDDQSVRTFVRQRLAEWGYDVLEAADGEEALQLAGRHPGPIHLLLTDVVMPGMSGAQLAEQVKSRWPETKIVFMSGYPGETIARHGLQELEGVWLQKPFSPLALQRKIRNVLDAPGT